VFHYLNGSLREHPSIGDAIEDFVAYWAFPLFVVATFSLWLLDRPCMPPLEDSLSLRSRRGRIGPFLRPGDVASLDGRKHPFQAHPSRTLLASPSQEPSFPSDHAVAAFAIAFSVALVRGRRAGVFFLAAASVVITRVFGGLHYPGDIAGGALIGLIAALAVFSPGSNRWSPVVATLSRLTDPLVALLESVRRRERALLARRGRVRCFG
jgi:membrane-associated phospholipid phosphatase